MILTEEIMRQCREKFLIALDYTTRTHKESLENYYEGMEDDPEVTTLFDALVQVEKALVRLQRVQAKNNNRKEVVSPASGFFGAASVN